MKNIGYNHRFISESTVEKEFPEVLQALLDKHYNDGWKAAWEAATKYFEGAEANESNPRG